MATAVFGGTAVGIILALAVFQIPAHMFVGSRTPSFPDLIQNWRVVTFYRANIALLVAYLPIAAMTWWMARLSTPRPIAAYFRPVRGRIVVWCLIAGPVVMAVTASSVWLLKHRYGVDLSLPESFFETAMMPTTPAELALSIVAVGMIGPLAEEFFFRGLLLRWLMKRWSSAVAIAVSAAVFSLSHGTLFGGNWPAGMFHFADIAIFGVVAGVLVVRTGSLLPGYALHFAYNTAIAVASLLPLPS